MKLIYLLIVPSLVGVFYEASAAEVRGKSEKGKKATNVGTMRLSGSESGSVISSISKNVPEPTSYSGRNFIALDFPQDIFIQESPKQSVVNIRPTDRSAVKSRVAEAMKSGFSDPTLFPNIKVTIGSLKLIQRQDGSHEVVGTIPISQELAHLDPEEVAGMAMEGRALNIYRSMYGPLTYNYIQPIKPPGAPDDPGDPPTDPEPKPPAFEITHPENAETVSGPSSGIILKIHGAIRRMTEIEKV